MEYIDKKKGKKWAHPLLLSFLNRCQKYSPYPADLYDTMKSDVDPDTNANPGRESTYKRLLTGILDESNGGAGIGHCCYCMRTISASGTHSTLEHVIPNKTPDQKEYNRYYSVPSNLEKDEHVMVFKEVFLSRHKASAPPFPHNVAYENLVASCDGCLPKGSLQHICCNNPRGDHYIPPFMFMSNIHDEFVYKAESGLVIWKSNPHLDRRERTRVVNNELNLNCDILRMIRRIWCFLAENDLDCVLPQEERRRIIDTLRPRFPLGNDRELIQNFVQDQYWLLLEDYRYFNDKNKFS